MIESSEVISLSPARSIRHRVKYSIGLDPTVSLNLIAKMDRDMPTLSANSFTVQGWDGLACIATLRT